ncbi:hypothetical protein EDC94DRAFT_584558 [Helicostylum pulchrum]|nr:hypothetical protein EDC94DRAFT_584558 [Helicostylum pulchrum]
MTLSSIETYSWREWAQSLVALILVALILITLILGKQPAIFTAFVVSGRRRNFMSVSSVLKSICNFFCCVISFKSYLFAFFFSRINTTTRRNTKHILWCDSRQDWILSAVSTYYIYRYLYSQGVDVVAYDND